MRQTPVRRLEPAGGAARADREVPAIVHSPHAGSWIPPEVRTTRPADVRSERRLLTDLKVDVIHAVAPFPGATVFCHPAPYFTSVIRFISRWSPARRWQR